MHGSRNFRQGGGCPGQSNKKADNLFLVLSLFYRRQMVNFKENYQFSRFLRGSNIFQAGMGSNSFRGGGGGGGSNCLFPIENIYLVIFQGRSGPPAPLLIRTWDCPWYYHASNLINRYLCMFLEGQVDRQTDRQTDRQKGAQTANAKTIFLRLHRGKTSTEHRIFSVMFKNTTQCFR